MVVMPIKTVIYPGTFDPITLGHMDLVKRVAALFDQVIVAVAANTRKLPAFTLEERIELATISTSNHNNVTVLGFEGLLIDLAHKVQASVILRGLRAVADFEYEFQLAGMNRHMAPHIETIFMAPGERFTFLSASLVREVAALGGDVSDFVHPEVKKALCRLYA